uniref:AlNc14C50G3974 protein n=1 Tax=Albugo laibachii Nc14 TaxID=890382 RepID=F0WBC7_9STRA|nr:AlNc14C50G3974 [Albugo laibachii Nc14]|eukprot:CCA18451.1 AlNc14C50G3974 [Albugo laibachii Nc14]
MCLLGDFHVLKILNNRLASIGYVGESFLLSAHYWLLQNSCSLLRESGMLVECRGLLMSMPAQESLALYSPVKRDSAGTLELGQTNLVISSPAEIYRF